MRTPSPGSRCPIPKHAQLPADGEVVGLLGLMLLTDARRPARTRSDGAIVALEHQDRSLWDAAAIAEASVISVMNVLPRTT